MGKNKEFLVQFSGLKDGSHEYSFHIGNAFFEEKDYSEIRKGNINVEAEMVRRPQMLTFDLNIKGEVEMTCDRCGNTYMQPLEGTRNLVVNLDADEFSDEDDLINLPAGAYEIDLSQYIYEYITLLVPQKRICPESIGCNPEMLKKLEELEAAAAKKKKTAIDPRWEKLKNIKTDN